VREVVPKLNALSDNAIIYFYIKNTSEHYAFRPNTFSMCSRGPLINQRFAKSPALAAGLHSLSRLVDLWPVETTKPKKKTNQFALFGRFECAPNFQSIPFVPHGNKICFLTRAWFSLLLYLTFDTEPRVRTYRTRGRYCPFSHTQGRVKPILPNFGVLWYLFTLDVHQK